MRETRSFVRSFVRSLIGANRSSIYMCIYYFFFALKKREDETKCKKNRHFSPSIFSVVIVTPSSRLDEERGTTT